VLRFLFGVDSDPSDREFRFAVIAPYLIGFRQEFKFVFGCGSTLPTLNFLEWFEEEYGI
jgi:hypothetical protein